MATPMQTPQPAPKLSPEAFAQKVKAKYPQYAKIPDAELASKISLKHPEYKDKVDWSAAAPTQPNTYKPPTPSPAGQTLEKVGHSMAEAAPSVMGATGSVAGGLIAGPAGAVRGAMIGGAVGETEKELAESGGKSLKGWDVAKSAAGQGALEYFGGQLAPKAIRAIGAKALKSADDAMVKVLGLKFSKTQAIRGSQEALRKIADTVKGSTSLSALAEKIGVTKEGLTQATEDIVQGSKGAKLVPYQSHVSDAAVRASDEALAFNQAGRSRAILETAEQLEKRLPPNATPKEVLDVRRQLLKEKDAGGQPQWPAGTRQFRKRLYHDLNGAIGRALPPSESAKFVANNSKVTKLIEAEEAVSERLAKQTSGQESKKSLSEAAKHIAGKSILPAVGAEEGYRRTHSVAGAAIGAAMGAAGTAALSSTASKSAAIGGKRLISRAAPSLAKAAEYIPSAARTMESIRAIQSRPQGNQ